MLHLGWAQLAIVHYCIPVPLFFVLSVEFMVPLGVNQLNFSMSSSSHFHTLFRPVSCSVADPDPFDTDPDPAFQFDPDPDPYSFKEVMYLKQYFLCILTWFSLSVGPTGPNQTAYFVKFLLQIKFVVLIKSSFRIRILEHPDDTDPFWSGSATLVSCRKNTVYKLLPVLESKRLQARSVLTTLRTHVYTVFAVWPDEEDL